MKMPKIILLFLFALLALGVLVILRDAPKAEVASSKSKKAKAQKVLPRKHAAPAVPPAVIHGGVPAVPTPAQTETQTTAPVASQGVFDAAIAKALAAQKIPAAPVSDDASFHRRASLILTGRIPSWQAAKAFIADKSADKREKLIDTLMASPAFTDFQVLKWGDLFRVKAEFPSNIWPNGVQAYNRWIREQVANNRPYDEMVYELLTSTGSNFRSPAVNFFRAFQKREPQAIADNAAMIFLGQRTSEPAYAPFFSQLRYKATREWKEEIVYVDLDAPLKETSSTMPDGQELKLEAGRDNRRAFARWLVGERGQHVNRLFARTMANRVWFWLMGRGVIHPVDDMRADNAPSNPELLDALENAFVSSGYDVQALMRRILLSDAFARSSVYQSADLPKAAAQFAYYPTQRMGAEQIVDAINDVTGEFDVYTSLVPEPYSYFPKDMRSVQIGDGSVSSPQLELFGRPSRDVSLESDRNNELNAKQVLYLLNSGGVLKKLEQSNQIATMSKEANSREELIERCYLMALGRVPRQEEQQRVTQLLAKYPKADKAAQMLLWALLNSPEFLFNH